MGIPQPDILRKHPGPARLPRARLQHLVGRLHALGPRATLEYVSEIIAGADPVSRLEAYAHIDGRVLDALDGRDLPRLRAIGGHR